MIGSKFSRHFFNQSEVKPKPIVTRACTFSRALCRLRVITSSFDWFTGLSLSFLIGQSNYFGFGFTTLDWNSLYRHLKNANGFNGIPTRDHCEADALMLYQLSYKSHIVGSRGTFLESPENFSGAKTQLRNCKPLVFERRFFNVFSRYEKEKWPWSVTT